MSTCKVTSYLESSLSGVEFPIAKPGEDSGLNSQVPVFSSRLKSPSVVARE